MMDHRQFVSMDIQNFHHFNLGTRAANDPSVFTIMEKASTRAFSWLKCLLALSLLRHSVIVKTDGSFAALLGPGPVNCGADGEI